MDLAACVMHLLCYMTCDPGAGFTNKVFIRMGLCGLDVMRIDFYV